MGDFFSFLGDLGSGAMDVLGNVGSAIGNVVKPIGDFASSLSPILNLGMTGWNMAQADQPQQQQVAQQAPPTQPAPQGGGFMDSVGKIAQAVAPAVGLASTGLAAANAFQGMDYAKEQQDYLQKLQDQNLARAEAMRPVQEAGANQYLAGQQAIMGGTLPPALEAQVAAWEQDARGKIRSYLARAGISEGSSAQQYEAWIGQQSQIMRGQLARELQTGGLAGFTAGTTQPQDAWFSGLAGNQAAATNDLLRAGQQALQLLTGQQTKPTSQPGGIPGSDAGTTPTNYRAPGEAEADLLTAEQEQPAQSMYSFPIQEEPSYPYANLVETNPEQDLSWLTGQQQDMKDIAERVAAGELAAA